MPYLHGIEIVEVENGVRPIKAVRSSVIGVVGTAPEADDAKFPLNTPVLLKKDTDMQGIGATGYLPQALSGIFKQINSLVVVIRVEEGADDAGTQTNIIGGVDSGTGARTGLSALLEAKSVCHVSPKIVVAQFSDVQAVATEMVSIAGKLRAVAIVDGPNTTDTAAITYAGNFDSDRMYLVDPHVKVFSESGDVVLAGSPFVAGLIAKTDEEKGFWFSPSNQTIDGIVGTSRAVDFGISDPNCSANVLNESKVATIVHESGYRLWGNKSLTTDAKWAFLNVRRTADMIHEALLASHLWAVDRGITKNYMEDVKEGVNRYLRDLQGRGAILGGECWVDPDANTPDQIQQGIATFDFDFTPVYPAEHIVFKSSLTDKYITNLFR